MVEEFGSSSKSRQASARDKKPSDEDLIERFQKGDLYAFDLIVKRYKDQLINFAYRFLGGLEDSEDIVQETFLRVYRKKNAYKNVISWRFFTEWFVQKCSNYYI